MTPLLVLAESDGGATRVLAVFTGIALVGIAATFATTRIYARLQRRRWVAALTAGGWFAMLTGVLIGPRVLAVVDGSGVQPLRPILDVALAWIGLIIGLQLRRALVLAIPPTLVRWLRNDSAASLLAGIATVIAWWFIARPEVDPEVFGITVIGLVAAFIGWAPETRSLRPALTPRSGELAQLVQAGGGLGAVLTVLLFGFGTLFIRFGPGDPSVVAPWTGLMELGLSALIAILLGFGAKILLRQTTGAPQESLVVTLALVLLAAGFAAAFGLSPLLNGLLTGVVIANLRDPHLRDLERALQRAEPGMAVLMLIASGSLVGDADLLAATLLGLSIAGIRLLLKPFIARSTVGSDFSDLSGRDALFLGPARVPLVAIAVAVGPAIATENPIADTVLAAVMIATLLGAVLPGIAGRRPAAESVTEAAT
ncbi:MAG: hypothetical protein GY895_23530 [Phycisphaera sp.]|nr:hypothetical protein [Phycisphaera sp.]